MPRIYLICLLIVLFTLLIGGQIRPNGIIVAQEVVATPAVDPCAVPIVYNNRGQVNVRSGPGLDYDIVGTLALYESRPIVGRAPFAPWWLIELEDATLGWVSSETVEVYGHGANVPLIAAPEIGGVTPTPGQPWLVTPHPPCLIVPTPTVTPTPLDQAPAGDQDLWNQPINLSRSGAATSPQLLLDSAGRFHALWLDEIDGFIYSTGDGSEWTQPTPGEFPFATRRYYPELKENEPTPYFIPTLISDGRGRIHAFWIDTAQALYYSSVAESQFATYDSWTTRQQLAPAALSLDASLDSAGRIHLAFIRPVDESPAPAGLYYSQLSAPDNNWSTPISLYQSRYFRSLSQELAHLDLFTPTIGQTIPILIALDDRPQEKILLFRSNDNGQSWDTPRDVDHRQPTDDAQATTPSQALIGLQANNLLLTWQAGHEESNCTQYYQSSSDGGLTWQEPQPLNSLRGCAQNSQFFTASNGLLILFTNASQLTGDTIYLLAWDGQKWSEPQAQETLLSFPNPDTYRVIHLACHQATLANGNTLFVIGCDTEGNKDSWLLNRPLGDSLSWFPLPPIWNSPELLETSDIEPLALQMVADSQNQLHAIWGQEDGLGISYATYNGALWSPPITVLRTPNGRAYRPMLTINSQDQLFVIWSGNEAGTLYFSWAPAGEASSASAWAAPGLVPAPRAAISSSAILVGPDNQIYVAFAIPLNEERGIYFTRSTNRGDSWEIPQTIINAAQGNLAMVDLPKLALTGAGDLHLIWTEFALPPLSEPLALYYSRRPWGEESWSEPEQFVRAEADWAMIAGFGPTTVHRLWLTGVTGNATLWHQLSIDGGQVWREAESIAGVGSGTSPTSLSVAVDGQLQLLQLFSGQLLHWNWDGSRWLTNETDLLTNLSLANGLAGVVLADGRLEAIYSGTATDSNTGNLIHRIYFTGRQLIVPSIIPTPIIYPTLTPQPSPTIEPSPTPTITPTAVTFPTEFTTRPRLPIIGRLPTTPWFTMLLAVLPVILLVAGGFTLALRRVRIKQQ